MTFRPFIGLLTHATVTFVERFLVIVALAWHSGLLLGSALVALSDYLKNSRPMVPAPSRSSSN